MPPTSSFVRMIHSRLRTLIAAPPTQDNLFAECLQFYVVMAEPDLPKHIQWTIPCHQQVVPGAGQRFGGRAQPPRRLYAVHGIHAFAPIIWKAAY